jgi:predicted HD phosphohydrolase
VFVYTGLLDILPDDNAMLAAVLAHEVAHVVERHSVENLGVSDQRHCCTSADPLVPQCRCCRFRCTARDIICPHYLVPAHHRYCRSVYQLAQRCGGYESVLAEIRGRGRCRWFTSK